MEKICALWGNTAKSGRKYQTSGWLSDEDLQHFIDLLLEHKRVKIMIFKNEYKKESNQPDVYLFIGFDEPEGSE